MKLVRYTGSEDWSALYVDGMLDRVGDHYLIDERISEIAGVTEYNSDVFLLGTESPASKLEDIHEYEIEKFRAEDEAKALRLQAKELIEKAEKLEKI